MKVLKEYRINKNQTAPQTIYITSGADIVNLIDLDFDVALIALCDKAEFATDLRTFQVCDLASTIYEDNIKYIGNFGAQHLIEIL